MCHLLNFNYRARKYSSVRVMYACGFVISTVFFHKAVHNCYLGYCGVKDEFLPSPPFVSAVKSKKAGASN